MRRWTGEYQYTIDQVLDDMIDALPRARPAPRACPRTRRELDFTALLTVQTMNYLHSGRHRVAL